MKHLNYIGNADTLEDCEIIDNYDYEDGDEETIAQFINKKIRILKDFRIKVTSEIIQHMQELNSQIAIDNYSRFLILGKLGEDFTRGSAISRY